MAEQLRQIEIEPGAILLEPIGRNTGNTALETGYGYVYIEAPEPFDPGALKPVPKTLTQRGRT